MDHFGLSDELRQTLMESAAWNKADISPRIDERNTENKKKKNKATGRTPNESGDVGAHSINRGETPANREEHDKIGYARGVKKVRGAKPGAKPKMVNAHTEYEDAEGYEEYEEDVHVCPLCVSQLDEAIDEERILEHLNVVVGLVERLSQLNEGEEDVETVIDETIAELLLQDDEDYDEDYDDYDDYDEE